MMPVRLCTGYMQHLQLMATACSGRASRDDFTFLIEAILQTDPCTHVCRYRQDNTTALSYLGLLRVRDGRLDDGVALYR